MRSRFALPFAAAILLSLAACSGWVVVQPPPRGPEPTRIAGRAVRVTRVGGEVLNLATAEIHGDTLYGMRLNFAGDRFLALPLAEVAGIEAERTSDSVPVLLGFAAAVGLLWLVVASTLVPTT